MVDANNGFDGNDGANQGERKNEGGHDMYMDNKGRMRHPNIMNKMVRVCITELKECKSNCVI
jgi:hypothetical protein